MDTKFCFAIDRGGTFTDVYARCPGNKIIVLKLLSENPYHYKDAPTEGIRRVIEKELGIKIPTAADIDTNIIGWIRMGTTVATNALLERRGTKMALAITKGFKDLLYIGNQARPDIFDLVIKCPEVLYESVIEVDERVIPSQGLCDAEVLSHGWRKAVSTTGENLIITRELDEKQLKEDLTRVHRSGIDSLAVLLMHSYMFNEHELLVKKAAEDVGFKHVSISSYVMPMVKAVPRGYTACSDAYLTPHIKSYLKDFSQGFKNELTGVNVLFMQSDGGLTKMNSFMGSRAILSGPAGGVVGCAMTAYNFEKKYPVIGFDMGGTSTDVSRFAGKYEHVFESTTAGITLQAPQLDINTVAAGGGSRLFYRSEMFVIGPESVGAFPGPVCYKKGGNLAVTDANLALGRLLPAYFPKIFGPKENEALDLIATSTAFTQLLSEINEDKENEIMMTVEEVAMGFIRVANEAMCRPIRALTQGKGHDTSRHILSVFGGAGGQHACAIARSLGMSKVFIHKYSGILSAFGMALADVVHEAQEPCAKYYNEENLSHIETRFDHLVLKCEEALKIQGFASTSIRCEAYLNLRYEGTDCALMCIADEYPVQGQKYGNFQLSFLERYKQEFGFEIMNRRIVVDDIRIRGVAISDVKIDETINESVQNPVPEMVEIVYFEQGYRNTKIYLLSKLLAGDIVIGPAIIIDQLATILVEPDCEANITKEGNVVINICAESKQKIGCELDSIQLSIFSHRFMSIAEQMGRILQRTSISTNIKERLDFSCALFGPDGGLVSNAPHIPVHLGAMQETVQYQLKTLAENINEGDVILANHPSAGGSHLPDLTVVTPVFYRGITTPVFYVASRGHHADIGGSTPGSMPPHSTSIYEEGAVFHSFKLVKAGVFQEEKLIEKLKDPGKHDGCSGTRNLQDNLSDLKAQIAANNKGIILVNELIDYYGLEVIQAYMMHIQSNAEKFVKQLLIKVGSEKKDKIGSAILSASDYMDDGSIINLVVSINEKEGTAVFDFQGTGPEVWGNCNAPKAVTVSAIIYCLRALVGYDIPLNQGCLKPVEILIPENTILNPSDEAAVVGGNVQTSQRVVDVVLKAFGACAASQGCMNNITFGDENVGYYETVAGGAGAGPTWNGRSGIHTHMTNTRITDPEILENRYPVTLKSFRLNPNTGGDGKYRGGDGVIREILFRKKLTLSILTERRVFHPYGLEGGKDGCKGENLLIRKSKMIRLPSKTSVSVDKGDILRLQTPGGGGYGDPSSKINGYDESCLKSQTKLVDLKGSLQSYLKNQESA